MNMTTITDDELLLYHYRELDDAERARIGAALAADPELARRLHALVARLDAAAAMPEVPVPPEAQQRWQAALERVATGTRAAPKRGRSFGPPMWLAAAASITVVALVFAISNRNRQPSEVTAEIADPATQAVTPPDNSAYANGLKVHLASTERRIANLDEASPEERARLIETIIAQNRIYALAAERAGEPQLARVLRAFNPILEDLAKGGGQDTADISQLSFELRVMQARLGAGAAPINTL
jgi:hypothetical protein